MRDDFPPSVKRLLAERVGFCCSNPDCQQSTSGPSADPSKSVNIGVAAHITAAAPGGQRYDASLSKEERRSPENGIWLCQNCAKLVDNDPKRYSSKVLNKWKLDAEARALRSVHRPSLLGSGTKAQTSIVVLANQLDHLAARMSGETEQRLELMHAAWREGRRDEAVTWLKNLKSDATVWPVLSPQVKAKLLCFEAGLELDVTGDFNRAKQLADEAEALAPSDNQTRLRALIAYRETGPAAAIELLEGQEDIDSLNLKAALLLEMGRADESLAVLNLEEIGPEANDET